MALSKVTAVQISSASILKKVKLFVQDYFRELRQKLIEDLVTTDDLDTLMQELLHKANKQTSKSVYLKVFKQIIEKLVEAEISREYLRSKNVTGSRQNLNTYPSDHDTTILKVLESINSDAALSYRQVLADIQVPKASYRGTAAELREVLRETLEYLAPDADVMATPGFKLEPDRSQPTMKQKVLYILKNRNVSKTLIEAPMMAANIVDESISSIVRATYNRGSVSAHVHTNGKAEILQIKMYLDSILCDLLEIHKNSS